MDNTKEVYFHKYCSHCEHFDEPVDNNKEDPCDECLENGYNIDSHKPINFKGDYIPPENSN